MDILEFQERLFAKGKKYGFGDMEIYYYWNINTSVDVLDNKVDNYEIAESCSLSFKGIYNNNSGYSYTEKLDEESIDFLINEAKTNAEIVKSDVVEELFEGAEYYDDLDHYSETIINISPQALIEAALEMERMALKSDSRIKEVIGCNVNKFENEIVIANTKGLDCHSKYAAISGSIYLMATDGKQIATGGEYDFSFRDISEMNFHKIVNNAVTDAVSKLGANSIDSGNYNIIFRRDTATELFGAFITNFSGEAVEKGFSKLEGKLGEQIAGENITIIDDPLMKDSPNACAFDDEGYPTKKMELVKNGMLLNFMHNRKTAKKAGTRSTGNAKRGGSYGEVSVGPNNLYLKPGEKSFNEIIKSTKNGILIIELEGTSNGINSMSGDFSLSAKGFVVENGEVTRSLNEIVVSGNMYEMFNNIEEIASDLKIQGSVTSPTVKVKSLAISGR